MSSATFINLRINSAEQFKESVSEPAPNTNIYLAYGKTTAWANESNPDIANTSVDTQYDVWKNMIAAKRILGYDISHIIKRYNWTSGATYIAYDNRNPNLYSGNNQFYVLTSDYNVYKCIANNNGQPSTVEPTSINPNSLTETSDRYVWKYMYTLSDSDLLRFTTLEYIPVKTLQADDGSLQYRVQQAAQPGAIYSIVVSNTGSGYVSSSNVIVTVSGDGTSATAFANVNTTTQTVSSITLTDYGVDYTYATVTISGGGGSGAEARAIISPPGGHGSNPLYELGGNNLIINPVLRASEEGSLQTTNDFRQISLIKDPLKQDGNVSTNLRISQTLTLRTVGTGDYQQDEVVYQGPSLSASSFSARVLSWDSANNILRVINTNGTPTTQSLIGLNTSTSRFVDQITDKELRDYTGQILYVNNLGAITRSTDQTEDFKIVVKF